MGMAASQARYLALVARKSNCEYEGQQINQARLALSNQSANLFNQMLGLSVPVPPSTSDYTKKQYSFTDGVNNAVIETWHQLAQPDSEGYNYVVDYYYNAEEFHGSQKKMNDPQVQFSLPNVAISSDYSIQVANIQAKLKEIEELKKAHETAKTEYSQLYNNSKKISTYQDRDTYIDIQKYVKSEDGNTYTITRAQTETDDDGNVYELWGNDSDSTIYKNIKDKKFYTKNDDGTYTAYTDSTDGYTLQTEDITFTKYDSTAEGLPEGIADAINVLKECDSSIKPEDIFYTSDGTLVLKSDIEKLVGGGEGTGTMTYLPAYHITGDSDTEGGWRSTSSVANELETLRAEQISAQSALDLAEAQYKLMNVPEYIGNTKLTALTELTESQISAIKQIIADMKEQDVNTNFTNYFNPDTNEYSGGIYSFTLNGVTYYTTYDDLAESYINGTGINNIDDQPKLAYYTAGYITQKVTKQEKAILETDSSGRFTSIRLGDDTIKYTLNVETITDDAAYQDAMNQYYYDNAKYDKMVQDINAKTSLIQQEDRTLELRLKQLDTEQNALSTEIDAVAKVVKDNVEKSFKTFSG